MLKHARALWPGKPWLPLAIVTPVAGLIPLHGIRWLEVAVVLLALSTALIVLLITYVIPRFATFYTGFSAAY